MSTENEKPNESAVLTTEEAAEFLRVHPNTVRNLVKKRKLPGKKIGQQIRIPRAALEQFLAQGEPTKAA